MEETPLIGKDLLKLLVCPKSGGKLKLMFNKLVCEKSSTTYIIQDGIPIMMDDSLEQ
ncbi:MAG: hypothetical protein LBF44_00965 [Holosporaceae bacterium]|jgi:uncharacterized protein YbaR (Trm112 family)|nr:hypothetical protein [Holosporaceae bacterium]